jgi:predicted TIM-barrel fold metal-dependent hydrolase
VSEYPERRAGIGQIFLNDLDDAIADVKWIKDHDLRGGILVPNVPPDVKWIKPLNHPDYDRLWAVCEDLEVPVNSHGGTGAPEYAKTPSSAVLMVAELPFWGQRPFVQLLVSGVIERFPRLRFVMTEMGCAWVPGLLSRLDYLLGNIKKNKAIGELRYRDEEILPRSATEYFHQNCWMGVSQPSPDDVEVIDVIGKDRFMWGSDYPHDEGTHPFTREHLRQLFSAFPEKELRAVLGGNCAELYGFDLDKLAPIAERVGPGVDELATPLDSLPADANEALLRAAAG